MNFYLLLCTFNPLFTVVDILQVLSYLGIFVFAVTGVLKARTKQFDLLGAVILSFVMAYGGGTTRDVLIGIRPVNWVNDNFAIIIVLVATILTFFFKLDFKLIRKVIFWTDAFGIGFFTIVGLQIALQAGIGEGYALIMGVITATFGGLIADILCNEVPNLLKPGELYATACLLGGGLYLGMKFFNINTEISMIIGVLVTAAIRIYSIRKKLQLPVV